ncbi:hypothetical protein [Aeromonas dhakensis]|uniref:hypothetical protein n=1 Tax=Aeromonas dhakensis TaxID=196024 RepID=UPI003570BDDF
MAAWQHGSMAAWQHGSMAAWQHGSMDHMAWFDWLNILLASPPSLLPFVTKNSNIHKQFTYCHGIMPVMNPDKGS